jgi:hypothetical protein
VSERSLKLMLVAAEPDAANEIAGCGVHSPVAVLK